MRVPQVVWRWGMLRCDGEGGRGVIVAVCVDGCVMSVSSAAGVGVGWAMGACIVAGVGVSNWVVGEVVWGIGV